MHPCQGWLECTASKCSTAQQDTAVGKGYVLLAGHVHLQLPVNKNCPVQDLSLILCSHPNLLNLFILSVLFAILVLHALNEHF